MKIKKILSVISISLLISHVGYSQVIYEFKSKTKDKNEIKEFFVRKPKGMESEEAPVNGVICYSSFSSSREKILNYLSTKSDFADKHGLAIISWTRAKFGHDKKSSFEDLKSSQRRHIDKAFEPSLRSWKRSIPQLVRKYNLPKENYLMFGISGGAQWAHRFAMREPHYFAAVHIAIGSTFNKPTARSKDILWLITTGELEVGYQYARSFYNECKRLDYIIAFKASENVGHKHTSEAEDLGAAFFTYALKKIKESKHDPMRVKKNFRAEYKNATYYADYINQIVVPKAKRSLIQAPFSVNIQTKEIAQAWGYIVE